MMWEKFGMEELSENSLNYSFKLLYIQIVNVQVPKQERINLINWIDTNWFTAYLQYS